MHSVHVASAIAVVLWASSATRAEQNLTSGLVAHYAFDEGTGSTARDIGAQPRPGRLSLTNDSWPDDWPDAPGHADKLGSMCNLASFWKSNSSGGCLAYGKLLRPLAFEEPSPMPLVTFAGSGNRSGRRARQSTGCPCCGAGTVSRYSSHRGDGDACTGTRHGYAARPTPCLPRSVPHGSCNTTWWILCLHPILDCGIPGNGNIQAISGRMTFRPLDPRNERRATERVRYPLHIDFLRGESR